MEQAAFGALSYQTWVGGWRATWLEHSRMDSNVVLENWVETCKRPFWLRNGWLEVVTSETCCAYFTLYNLLVPHDYRLKSLLGGNNKI